MRKRSLTPWWPLTLHVLRSHVWLYPRTIVSKSHENTSKYVDSVTLFAKNLNFRSLTPRWHLTPHLLRSHVWLYPRIIASKSHGNINAMYVDTVINFANYHMVTCVTLPKGHCVIKVPWKYIKSMWIQWPFLQKLEPKVIDPLMTFDWPHICWGYMCDSKKQKYVHLLHFPPNLTSDDPWSWYMTLLLTLLTYKGTPIASLTQVWL